MPRIRLVISGIASPAEAQAAVAAGADAIGLDPDALPPAGLAGNGILADIALALPPTVTPILLTHALTAGTIAQQVDAAAATAVRIARPLSPGEYPGLKRIIRGRKIIQSLVVEGAEAPALAASCAEFADALHLEAAAEHLPLCRKIAEGSGLPVFLTIGSPETLPRVLTAFRPFGISVAAPRRDGRIDGDRIARLAALLG